MSYDTGKIEVTLRISNHQDERDEQHRLLQSDLTDRIQRLINEPQYADIEPELESY